MATSSRAVAFSTAIAGGPALLAVLLSADAASDRVLWREQWWWFLPLFVFATACCVFALLSLISTYVYELPTLPTLADRKAKQAAKWEAALTDAMILRSFRDELDEFWRCLEQDMAREHHSPHQLPNSEWVRYADYLRARHDDIQPLIREAYLAANARNRLVDERWTQHNAERREWGATAADRDSGPTIRDAEYDDLTNWIDAVKAAHKALEKKLAQP